MQQMADFVAAPTFDNFLVVWFAPRLLADGSIYVLAEPRNAARHGRATGIQTVLAVQRNKRYLP